MALQQGSHDLAGFGDSKPCSHELGFGNPHKPVFIWHTQLLQDFRSPPLSNNAKLRP